MSDRYVDKYRPKNLRQVVGQRAGVQQLEGLLRDNKVAGNTILISGEYGTGKTTLARILAYSVNCSEGDLQGACGKCRSCKMSISSHPDIREINAAEHRGIDEVRQIIETARLSPRNNCRVFILDELHQLTPHAANAFLKDLEEPSKKAAFILVTTEPHKLLKTIRSRSTEVKLSLVREAPLVKFLGKVSKKEGFEFSKEVLSYVAELSNGHVRDSLNLLEKLASSAGNASIDEAKEMLPEMVEEILGSFPDKLVPKYMTHLARNSIVPVVYLRKVTNVDHFMGMVLSFLKEYTFFKHDPRLVDNKGIAAFDKSLKGNGPSKERLVKLLEIHMDAIERVKRRELDPLDAYDLAILKSAQVVDA